MQIKFISLALVATFFALAVNAHGDTVGANDNTVVAKHIGEDIANDLNVNDVLNGLDVDVAERSLTSTKRVAGAVRRRAIARLSRRGEEADEEEAEEEEAEEEEAEEEEAEEEEAEEEEAGEDEEDTEEKAENGEETTEEVV